MPQSIKIHRDRTNVIQVSLGFDVSADTFSSQIRVNKDTASDLIATFGVSFATDGVDGNLILILDNTIVSAITHSKGYMDIKRLSGGEPYAVFDEPLEVFFKGTVTA